jgi:hypothetical protein
MFRGSVLSDSWEYAHRPHQRVVSGLSLGFVVFVSILLHGAGFTMPGDAPIPIIEVKLTEFAVEMPKAVPVGKMIFSVTNAGTMEHNFEVEGQGLEKKFSMNLKPGETRNLQMDLPAATYTVYCPVNDHRKRGMHQELTVAQQQSRRRAPLATFRVSPVGTH